MSELSAYKPFVVIRNAIDKLEAQSLLQLIGEKDRIVELITQDLIQAGILQEYLIVDRADPTNIHKTLENLVTEGGKVVFINKIEFDRSHSLLTLNLQFNPESNQIDKVVIFRDVQHFEEVLDEEESSDYLDSLIGLDQYSTRYILRTEMREIIFSSSLAPEIVSVER